FQLLFEGFSYQVLVANSGNEAVEIFRKESEKIDLVILDMTMPGMSGGEVFAKLKELDADLKVIVTSGRHAGEVESEDWLLGISGFIQKPIRAHEVNEKIREDLNFGNGGKPI
ncbi:MAG: response regulator, partial [bacterium]